MDFIALFLVADHACIFLSSKVVAWVMYAYKLSFVDFFYFKSYLERILISSCASERIDQCNLQEIEAFQ